MLFSLQALDSASEKVVQDALNKITADSSQTVIIVAHRLSTIRNADRIAVIDDGKIKEIGTHEEASQSHGLYGLCYYYTAAYQFAIFVSYQLIDIYPTGIIAAFNHYKTLTPISIRSIPPRRK